MSSVKDFSCAIRFLCLNHNYSYYTFFCRVSNTCSVKKSFYIYTLFTVVMMQYFTVFCLKFYLLMHFLLACLNKITPKHLSIFVFTVKYLAANTPMIILGSDKIFVKLDCFKKIKFKPEYIKSF